MTTGEGKSEGPEKEFLDLLEQAEEVLVCPLEDPTSDLVQINLRRDGETLVPLAGDELRVAMAQLQFPDRVCMTIARLFQLLEIPSAELDTIFYPSEEGDRFRELQEDGIQRLSTLIGKYVWNWPGETYTPEVIPHYIALART